MSSRNATRVALQVGTERWPLKAPIRISGYRFTDIDVVVVTLNADGISGRGEAAGVYYHSETPASMAAQIQAVREAVETDASRRDLLMLLPPGGARNALDCAMWELESKRRGLPVWKLAGLAPPRPLRTVFTLGADDPRRMADGARAFADARALKLKLIGDALDADRVRAVRVARPDVWLMVDANQGFTPDSFHALLPALVETGVQLVEQPFPVGRESDLDGLASPIRLAADESVQDHADLERLAGKVNVANIKLDKCGGLTEALDMTARAREWGLDLMVGNMGGTSLAMAPGFVIGQSCEVVDLDGPAALKADRSPAARYENGDVWCDDAIWGSPATP